MKTSVKKAAKILGEIQREFEQSNTEVVIYWTSEPAYDEEQRPDGMLGQNFVFSKGKFWVEHITRHKRFLSKDDEYTGNRREIDPKFLLSKAFEEYDFSMSSGGKAVSCVKNVQGRDVCEKASLIADYIRSEIHGK